MPSSDRDWSSDVCSDRKSTRLNFSHDQISYAVFCLEKKITPGVPCRRRPPRDPHARRETAPLAEVELRHGTTWEVEVDFFLMTGRPPRSTPFPSPTRFR